MIHEGRAIREERQERRATRRGRATVRVRLLDRKVERHTRLVDLSLGGARVLTATPPAIGDQLTMELYLRRGGPTVVARARVVWRSEGFRGRGGVIGVVFSSIENKGEILQFLNRR